MADNQILLHQPFADQSGDDRLHLGDSVGTADVVPYRLVLEWHSAVGGMVVRAHLHALHCAGLQEAVQCLPFGSLDDFRVDAVSGAVPSSGNSGLTSVLVGLASALQVSSTSTGPWNGASLLYPCFSNPVKHELRSLLRDIDVSVQLHA